MTTRWFSLRRRLFALLLGGVSAGWLVTMVFSYVDAHHEIDELFDAQLAQAAQTLLALAGEYDDDDDVVELTGDGHPYQKKLVFQLWDDEGRLLLRSRDAPTQRLTDALGYSERVDARGQRWLYYSQWDAQRQLRVEVGENHAVREELSRYIAMRLLAPAVLGLPLLGLWVWFAIRRGLAPIATVTDQVSRRAPEHLDALTPERAPEEIRPLVEALNALFARVDRAFDHERRFTADAAHELRTPLAALAAQAQVALRADDARQREQALARIVAGSQRAGRLVGQLLTLARLDPASRPALQAVALDVLATEACAELGRIALERHISLELEAPEAVVVDANADLLRVLLRNLIDNALRYTPEGGRVEVAVSMTDAGASLVVGDDGPGIPEGERDAALLRFHRLAGQEVEGSGLGLSIVARIAELHAARLTLGDGPAGKGLTVQVLFPAPATRQGDPSADCEYP
ncbi:MAG: sensor histidine kinase N-terminal domain-containing protein [Betaproteobacteria bacterium]|nr:sensor histidine kinase N-terminal domain-containing protein [Betaproteobacteria bacterium]